MGLDSLYDGMEQRVPQTGLKMISLIILALAVLGGSWGRSKQVPKPYKPDSNPSCPYYQFIHWVVPMTLQVGVLGLVGRGLGNEGLRNWRFIGDYAYWWLAENKGI